eukprot:CAMPEP_0184272984 /NCGR_PEP_ID=MMETSP0977-20130417/42611_1 /TAXON_ID=483370 /ORGANISM="non described non described, Strain CCMP2097" /LENGTH=63 /DNA_ID=CAMNT_0026578843 /DNA_START=101 /DNA_END=289 /DNA_ORIENTATION=-
MRGLRQRPPSSRGAGGEASVPQPLREDVRGPGTPVPIRPSRPNAPRLSMDAARASSVVSWTSF